MPLIANIVSYLHYHKSDLVCFFLLGLIHAGQAFSMNNSNVIYRVNAGGASYSDSVQKEWSGNRANGATNNVNTGRIFSSNKLIDASNLPHSNTDLQFIFNSQRWDDDSEEEMNWSFPVKPGKYEVRLYFSEVWSGAFKVGVREFDVEIEGAIVLSDFDIYAESGKIQAWLRNLM